MTNENVVAIPEDHRRLLPILPMLYIAWSNNILSPTEATKIREKMASMPWIEDKEKQLLERWLDPKNPPSPKEIELWLNTIRNAAKSQTDTKKMTLAELGVQIASIGREEGARCTSKESCQALAEIEDALNIVSEEARREILPTKKYTRESYCPSEESSFEVKKMTEWLHGEHSELKQKVRTLLRDPIFEYPPAGMTTPQLREQIKQWSEEIAKQGWGALFFPENYGGKSDLAKFIVMMQNLAFHDLSLVIKVGVQFGLFGGSVCFLGTKKHHEKYLHDIGEMKCMGCFAMTELGHGSNVRSLETTAHYDKNTGEFIIHTPDDSARKEYIGNAAQDGILATVFAQLIIDEQEYGVHAFLVPIRDENHNLCSGVKIEDCGRKLGLNGVDNGRMWFDQVRIPRDNLLDRFAQVDENGDYKSDIVSSSQRFFTMLSTLVAGRISIAAAALSAAKSGLTIAIRYATTRHQFGPTGESEISILNYPTHQKRLLPLVAKSYALDSVTKYLIERYANKTEEDTQEVEVLAAGIKAYSTWHTTHTLQTCRECCGGQGYLAVNRLSSLKADTEIFTTFEGDNTVLMQLVAKGLLGELKQYFHGMTWWDMVKHIAYQATVAVRELNPIATRLTDEQHLRNPEFHLEALQYRKEYSLYSIATRMKKRIDSGMDSYNAFIECQNQLVFVAKAFIENLVFEQFSKQVDSCEDENTKSMLKTLCDLYALNCIAEDRGWFMEEGYIEPVKSKAIMRQVSKLCREVKPQALHLVNAFDIPDHCLAAPIALS